MANLFVILLTLFFSIFNISLGTAQITPTNYLFTELCFIFIQHVKSLRAS